MRDYERISPRYLVDPMRTNIRKWKAWPVGFSHLPVKPQAFSRNRRLFIFFAVMRKETTNSELLVIPIVELKVHVSMVRFTLCEFTGLSENGKRIRITKHFFFLFPVR